MRDFIHINSKDNIQPEYKKLKLDQDRKRVEKCPCGKSNKDGKFVPFVGYNNCGYCHSCGETFIPEKNKPLDFIIPVEMSEISFISPDAFKDSLVKESTNYFVDFLVNTFGTKTCKKLIQDYFLDSYFPIPGSTIFWQIDANGRIRTGKVMLYDPATGKRNRNQSVINWIHKLNQIPNFQLSQCLFGEHLLQKTKGTVGLVESEKTAVIASAFMPKIIWLATGGKQGLKSERVQILKGSKVYVFPDLDSHEEWAEKVKEINQRFKNNTLVISDALQIKSSQEQRHLGWDLADFLLQDFQNQKQIMKSMFCN